MKSNLKEIASEHSKALNTETSLEDLTIIYCDFFKEQCIEEEYIVAFSIFLEEEYNITFSNDEEQRSFVELLAQISESMNEQKEETSSKSVRTTSVNLMSGIEFENLIEKLLIKMGFYVEATKVTSDGGIDLIAYSSEALFEGKYIIQCKRWSNNVGEPAIRDLYGVTMSENANKGILITNSNFTSNAVKFASGKAIELINGEKLTSLLSKLY